MKKFLLSIFAVLFAFAGAQAETVTDKLVATKFAATSTSYANFTNVKFNSDAVYAGNSAKTSGGAIQLRSKNSNSGIVTTVSGGKAKSVTIEVESGSNTLEIYGSNTPFSAAGDLYNTTATKLGSLSASGTLNITGDYEYIGLRSKSGALYLTSISIVWETNGEGGEETPVAPAAPTLPAACNFDDAMTVTITSDATVYYTTDDTTPSETNGTKYTAPFEITATTTVKAVAVNEGGSSEVVSATYTKNEPVTPPAEGESNTVTFTASANGYSNSATVTTVNIGDYITATFDKGTNSNAPKYYTSGSAIRCYGGNNFTIASNAGNITKIVLTFGSDDGSNAITTEPATYSNGTWTGSAKEVVFTIGGSSGNRRIAGIEVTYEDTGAPVVETVANPVIAAVSDRFNEGESLFVTIATETENAEIYYTLDGSDPVEKGLLYAGKIEITETTTVKAVAVKDGWKNSEVVEAKFTKLTVIEDGIIDVLNREFTGVEDTQYSAWEDKTSNSSAVYAGQSAGGNDAIQLRSNNSNSGIVTTVSGGKVKKISIDWNSNTAAERELWVYGSNMAYSSPADLYNAETDGNKLAEIPFGTLEFVIEGDYEYIGLRSGNGAMYLNSVEITWVVEEEEPVAESWSSFYAAMDTQIPAGVEAYIVTTANKEYVTLTQIFGTIPAMTGVIFKSNPKSNTGSEELANVEGNLLEGVLMNTNKTEEAYVLGCVDGEYGFYKADMNQQDGTAWLANAGKAYLPVSALPASAQGAASFSFRFGEGTTAIENVEVENEVKAIFDLTGRRIEAITAPGIYIVGGKKVLVK